MATVKFPQFKNDKSVLKVEKGLTLLDFARMAEIQISADCNGTGICGKCIVRVSEGEENLNELTLIEKSFNLKEKERLACQAKVISDKSDILLYIKNSGKYEILQSKFDSQLSLSPSYFQKNGYVFKGETMVDTFKGKIYGLAIDIGTTTIVIDLVDMETGKVIKTYANSNPQISYGNDVISRIEYTLVDNKSNGKYLSKKEQTTHLLTLKNLVVDFVNTSIKEFSKEEGKNISQYIYQVVLVGNPTMRNIFFGLDISSLGVIPYEAPDTSSIVSTPSQVGLDINKVATIYGGALIGGHIGSDVVADILVSGMYNKDALSLIIDIGTNGEIVLGNKKRMISASCAAGGAFEGASVSCGLGGIEGAIKEISIYDGRVGYTTIGNKKPVGVCGSGLIDLLAEFLDKNIMSKNARIKKDFYITEDLRLTQDDIFKLITSKSAIKTGWEILLDYYPAKLEDIDKIYLSGGFGNYVNITNGKKIGLIPDVDERKIIKIGNGSLQGAREMLISKERLKLSEEIASRVLHIKTNEIVKDFDYLLVSNMYF
ncbi:ASKHA domain-containing protein [bacterium]|nr:ASKHA domain-containing protein [bacterium]